MGYFNALAIWRAGGRAVRITANDIVPADSLDALVIGGGDDISPRLYHHELQVGIRIDPVRDNLEFGYLERATARRIPIMGTCRGAQILNVFRGGSLHPEIKDAYEGVRKRSTVLPRMGVNIVNDSQLYNMLGAGRCYVNALHHQSINRLGEAMTVSARDDDGIVQGVDCQLSELVFGVQWHPEFLVFDRSQQNLFRRVVESV